MQNFPTALAAGCLLASVAGAQRLASYTPALAIFDEFQPPTPELPAPTPPVATYPEMFALPPLPTPAGDSTFDNVLGYHWITDGMTLAAEPTPTFPPVAPPPPLLPLPAAVVGAIGGPVTGMALDPVAGIMWLVSTPGIVVGVAPGPGLPIVAPPFPIPFALGAPISGLEWDSVSGSLYAVDLAAVTYNFTPAGVGLGPPSPPPFPLGMPAGDVAIDRTLRLNASGMRPLYVIAGPTIFDVHDLAPIPLPAGAAPAEGLAFLNSPAVVPPAGTCLCPGTLYPTLFTTSPMTLGNAAWGVGVGGLPPGFPVAVAVEVGGAYLPAFPLVNGPGCGLGLVPGSPTTILFTGVADAFGNAVVTIPLTGPFLPLGAGPFYNQNVTFCPADPVFGLVFTPFQTFYVSAP